jgi:hypothetical protein
MAETTRSIFENGTLLEYEASDAGYLDIYTVEYEDCVYQITFDDFGPVDIETV